MKKILSLLLVICMVASMAALLPAFAVESTPEGDPISTVEAFKSMEPGGTYYLTNDLDFEDVNYDGTIGPSGFTGTFDGNGYTLKNILINSGSDTGVFGTGFKGTLKNLTIGTAEKPASITCTGGDGKAVGGVVCTIDGSDDATFENVTIYANVKGGGSKAGMFAGYIGTRKAVFTNCHTYGSVSGAPAAGFIATNRSDSPNLTFTNCSNNASVSNDGNNAKPVAGYYANGWGVDASDKTITLTFVNCQNNGSISSNNMDDRASAGGFVCLNTAGNQNSGGANVSLTNCVNAGTIRAGAGTVGGMIAIRSDGNFAKTSTYTMIGCINKGDVGAHDTNRGTSAAGLFAFPASNAGNANVTITNSANVGTVSGGKAGAGGIMTINTSSSSSGQTVDATVTGCFNGGTVSTADWRAGGIIGLFGMGQTFKLAVSYCYNSGTINAGTHRAAGIVGELDQNGIATATRTITNCYSTGTLIGGTRYAIAHAERGVDNTNITVSNSFTTLDATITDTTNVSGNAVANDTEDLLAKLTSVKVNESPIQFVADTYGINVGSPILSWQVPESVGAPAFSAGSMSFADSKYTISTEGVTGYISARVNGDKSDLRFVLAADMEAIKAYEDLSVTVEFCDVTGVVKSFTLGFDALTFYKEAIGAGNTYVAAEGDALFGLVVTDVPNDAWSYVILKVNTSAETAMAGKAIASSTINP